MLTALGCLAAKTIGTDGGYQQMHEHEWAFHHVNKLAWTPKSGAVFGQDEDLRMIFARELAAAAVTSHGKKLRVLSIGSGDCGTEIYLARIIQRHFEVKSVFICFEPFDEGFLAATKNIAATGMRQHATLSVIQQLPAETGTTFDAAFAHHALHHVADLETLLAVVRRAIGPDGVFFISAMVGRNGQQRLPTRPPGGSTPPTTNSVLVDCICGPPRGCSQPVSRPPVQSATVNVETTTITTPEGSVSASEWFSLPKFCPSKLLCIITSIVVLDLICSAFGLGGVPRTRLVCTLMMGCLLMRLGLPRSGGLSTSACKDGPSKVEKRSKRAKKNKGIDEWKVPTPLRKIERKGESNLIDCSVTSIDRIGSNCFAALLGTDGNEGILGGVCSGKAFGDDVAASSPMPSARTPGPCSAPCSRLTLGRSVQGAGEETEPTSPHSGFRFCKFCSSKLLCVLFTVVMGLGCSAFAFSSYSSGGVSELMSVFVPDGAATRHKYGQWNRTCDAACRADARCYAARYPDLKEKMCPPAGECLHHLLRTHYLCDGKAEGRTYGCFRETKQQEAAAARKAAREKRKAEAAARKTFVKKVTTQEVDSFCYLQRYPDVRERFCKPSELLSDCMLSSKGAQIQRDISNSPAGRHFGCNSRGHGSLFLDDKAVTSLKVVVPGHGSESRSETLYHSLIRLRRNTPQGVSFSCVVFVYRNVSTDLLSELCLVVRRKGLWTDFMLMEPLIGHSSSHVLLLLDDVFPFNLDLPTMLHTMEAHRVDVLSPAILPRWHWKHMNQGKHGLLKYTRYVDMLFVLFKRATWDCWRSLIDVELNHPGWGYDVGLSQLCNATLAVSDQHLALHTTGAGDSEHKERSYDEGESFQAMWRYFRTALHWEFGSEEDGMKALIAHNNAPPAKVVRGPPLSLLDPTYSMKQAVHRGGWRTVIEHLIRAEVLSINNRGDQPYLLDLVEKWFVWDAKGPILEPWVGMIHTTLNLPVGYTQDGGSSLWALFRVPAFADSLVWCRALVVFSEYLATDLRPLLPNVSVVAVKHPIGMTGKERESVGFDMHAFRAHNSTWQVVFLGAQYRRLATALQLQVPYPRLWLPGIKEEKVARKIFKERHFRETGRCLLSEETRALQELRIQYTSTFQEYDDLLLRNIVVIDVLDASANNAVLEAISMRNPVHMTNHPAIVEYVGSEYPLLFDNVTSLQALLNDRSRLVEAMRRAHMYLIAMQKEDLSLDSFAAALRRVSRKNVRSLPRADRPHLTGISSMQARLQRQLRLPGAFSAASAVAASARVEACETHQAVERDACKTRGTTRSADKKKNAGRAPGPSAEAA